MRVTICFLLFTMAFSMLIAQDFNRYKPITNSGDIPDEYISDAALIGYEDLKPAKNSDTYAEQKNRLDFIRFSDFYIRYLLRSGDLMFGDPLTNYVNNVADILLKNFPELREKFRFYVARYPEVNAACLPNGIVIVNMGLIAQLENEAQLGFVLAHEIVHYVKKHGIDAFLEQNRVKKRNNDVRSYSKDERIFAMLQYQKDQEFEADELGFLDYYLNSGYKLSEAEATCDVLLYSEFPVDEVRFENQSIEDGYFVLPSKYWKDTVDLISAIEDFDDTRLSHPNIKNRREKLQGLLNTYPDKGTEFIQPKEDFLKCREIARFELCKLFLTSQHYVDAIYLVNVLQQKHPDSEYLQKIKAKSWYGLAKLVHQKQTRLAIRSATKMKGESQRIFHLMKSMSNNELTIVACRELWKSHLEFPSDTLITSMTEQAFSLLLSNSKYRNNYFIFKKPVSDTAEVLQTDTNAELSKYDKIKQNQKKTENTDQFQLAFVAFADDEFIKFFNHIRSESSVHEENTSYYNPRKTGFTKDADLGNVDKIVILDPMYFRISSGKKSEERFLASSRYEHSFFDAINLQASNTGLQYSLIDAAVFNENDVDKYNDLQLLKDWLNEYNETDTLMTISNEQNELNDFAERYNTPYVAMTGVISNRAKRSPYAAAYAALFPPILPITVAYVLTPKYETLYFFEVYDIRSSRKVYSESLLSDKK